MVPYVAKTQENAYALLHTPTLWVVVVGSRVALGVLTVGDACPCPPAAIPPCGSLCQADHPKAVVGLTQNAVDALQERNLRWQQYVEFLEQRLQGGR